MRISKSPLESVANPANPGSVRICESDLEPSQVLTVFGTMYLFAWGGRPVDRIMKKGPTG